jgi:hypothetical protein
MWVVKDLEWREFLAYNIVCCYIQYHQPKGYGVLQFKVGRMGLYAFRYYYRLKYAYQEYYHQHQIVISSRPTFAMTWIETIPDHVVSQAHVELKQWKQLMDYCQ